MPSLSLDGKVAIVTGATSGIGQELALAMADAGARTVLVGRDAARLDAAVEQARTLGEATGVSAELTAADAPAAVVQAAVDAYGRIDAIVHAAGVFTPAPFETYALDELDRQWAVNVRAPFALTQTAVPHLKGHGSVIFISSIAGLVGFVNSVAYCTTKGAVELMSKALAIEYGGAGIRFNCIAPGNVRTPMNAHLIAVPEYDTAMKAATPLGRHGEVEDLSAAAVFLASDAAAYVTGASLSIDGGWTAQ